MFIIYNTATGSELFSLLTCLHTTTFTLLSIFLPLEMIRIKIWETSLSWHAKCSLRLPSASLKLPTDIVGPLSERAEASSQELAPGTTWISGSQGKRPDHWAALPPFSALTKTNRELHPCICCTCRRLLVVTSHSYWFTAQSSLPSLVMRISLIWVLVLSVSYIEICFSLQLWLKMEAVIKNDVVILSGY